MKELVGGYVILRLESMAEVAAWAHRYADAAGCAELDSARSPSRTNCADRAGARPVPPRCGPGDQSPPLASWGAAGSGAGPGRPAGASRARPPRRA